MSSEHPLLSHSETSKTIDLISSQQSRIVHVNLYPSCAEVTRLYRVALQKGRNLVKIRELPWAMDMESLRVEGISSNSETVPSLTVEKMLGFSPSKPPALVAAEERRSILERQLDRARKALHTLDTYAGTFTYESCKPALLQEALKSVRSSGEKIDEEIVALERALYNANEQVELEAQKHESGSASTQTPFQASIVFVVEKARELEFKLAYTANQAKWTPAYDMHVNMNAPNMPVSLTYKALITQKTGENWTNVPLTLRTSSPSVEFELPILESWPLSLQIPEPTESPQPLSRKRRRESTGGTPARKSGTYDKRNAAYEEEGSDAEEDDIASEHHSVVDENAGGIDPTNGVNESSTLLEGNVSATFQVPGKVTVSSNNAVQHTLIAEIKLDTRLVWASIPKGDPNVLVKAHLRNTSEYTLLPTTANVFVNGALHSKSEVPVVTPFSHFECSLGLDPSVRITYHPATKNTSTTGFYNKSRSYGHIQRISIQNAKSIPLRNLRIYDHLPVSENPQVAVKLISPALKLPGSVVEFGKDKTIPSVKVAEGIVAQWAGADERHPDVPNLGKDGKICWSCDIPAHGTVDLVLQWEVLTPPDAQVLGLY